MIQCHFISLDGTTANETNPHITVVNVVFISIFNAQIDPPFTLRFDLICQKFD